jgi:hypothetical protein
MSFNGLTKPSTTYRGVTLTDAYIRVSSFSYDAPTGTDPHSITYVCSLYATAEQAGLGNVLEPVFYVGHMDITEDATTTDIITAIYADIAAKAASSDPEFEQEVITFGGTTPYIEES